MHTGVLRIKFQPEVAKEGANKVATEFGLPSPELREGQTGVAIDITSPKEGTEFASRIRKVLQDTNIECQIEILHP